MDSKIEAAIITGVATVAGAIAGAVITNVSNGWHDKNQYKIEKMKLHAIDKLAAYKRLSSFGKLLRRRAYPMSEDKDKISSFEEIMKQQYFGKLENDSVYFSPRINKILNEFEDNYTCMNDPDLIADTGESAKNDIKETLFNRVEELLSEVGREFASIA